MGSDLDVVLPLFPGREESLRALAGRDLVFRELCSDYAECLATLERLRRDGGDASAPVAQYSELRLELECELRATLDRRLAGERERGR